VSGLDPDVEERMRAVLETGEAVTDFELALETAGDPGHARTWLEAWYPVREGGEVVGLGAVVVEVTARAALLAAEREARARAEDAERRARFLAQAGEQLASSLDVAATLERVVRLAVPDRADWCAVDLVRADGRLDRLARAATGAADGHMADRVTEVARTGGLHAGDDAIVVPLLVRGEVIGALSFGFMGAVRPPGAVDLDLAHEIARRAAAAIDNARLYEDRDHIARVLQRSLLPPQLPDVPGFELAARYRAAGPGHEVGGDFYDIFPTSVTGWSLVVGDVCGKGPEAASLTSLARYTARAAALVAGEPPVVLRLLHEAIVREHAGEQFMTAVCGHLELGGDGPVLDIACGGHPPPIVLRADGSAEVVQAQGALLGVPGRPESRTVSTRLAPGDAVALYTDGVTEAGAPEVVTPAEELARALEEDPPQTAAAVAQRLDEVATAQARGRLRDDVAIVVLRCDGDD
jgi:serine phosphatase RsbU (regulator of sigma subunit)